MFFLQKDLNQSKSSFYLRLHLFMPKLGKMVLKLSIQTLFFIETSLQVQHVMLIMNLIEKCKNWSSKQLLTYQISVILWSKKVKINSLKVFEYRCTNFSSQTHLSKLCKFLFWKIHSWWAFGKDKFESEMDDTHKERKLKQLRLNESICMMSSEETEL